MANININIQPYSTLQDDNIILVDGLTYERLKYKYGWLLNATVSNVLLGEDVNGLVWYRGDWLCGDWMDGTWYSGIFSAGTWYGGRWYSYQLQDYDIYDGRFRILDSNNTYSLFANGVWLNGNFYGGTFGAQRDINWDAYTYFTGYTSTGFPTYRRLVGGVYEELDQPLWVDGVFHGGIIYDTLWLNGTCRGASITNVQWQQGNFFAGNFNGHTWHNGTWYGGDFMRGRWLTGVFTQTQPEILSRFGVSTGTTTTCEWFDGTWRQGNFHSGLIVDAEGTTLPSTHHNLSLWYNGTWENGNWYGGQFVKGTWKNGNWYGGLFGMEFMTAWYRPTTVNTTSVFNSVNLTGNTWSNLLNWSSSGVSALTCYFSGFTLANYSTSGEVYQNWRSFADGNILCFSANTTATTFYTGMTIATLGTPTGTTVDGLHVIRLVKYEGTDVKLITNTTFNAAHIDIPCRVADYNQILGAQKASAALYLRGFSFSGFNTNVDNIVLDGIQVKANHQINRFGDPLALTQASELVWLNYQTGDNSVNSGVSNPWLASRTTTFSTGNGANSLMFTGIIPLLSANTLELGYQVQDLRGWTPNQLEVYDLQVRLSYRCGHLDTPLWENGIWYGGIFGRGVWQKGQFKKGIWQDGTMLEGHLGG